MGNRTALVSGAGIAGTTLAYWLAWHGFRPTVVERGLWQRTSGSPVDVRGQALRVAERMGVLARLRAAVTDVTGMRFVDTAGRSVGRVNLRALARSTGGGGVELPRGALASILQAASAEHAEFVFGDSIAGLTQDEHGVDVAFAPPVRPGHRRRRPPFGRAPTRLRTGYELRTSPGPLRRHGAVQRVDRAPARGGHAQHAGPSRRPAPLSRRADRVLRLPPPGARGVQPSRHRPAPHHAHRRLRGRILADAGAVGTGAGKRGPLLRRGEPGGRAGLVGRPDHARRRRRLLCVPVR